ncbi:DUF1284 domain-containing protein [Roseibium alexandrii]|uniref:DUF1284 domain-containing protein n=1 Tax=Roseibium alexandrii TaxID=388408 RepID=A0A0M6ZR67_9HYPH|nr:DUF1284 domain-containing protein [Roseibium alexandrii]CTQ64004.1 hypothetical protein LAX5112_00145 [Roseibium alexandrii]
MTIRLRAHHLLCMLTFAGKGYTPAFVASYKAIVKRLNDGAAIELVDGPDDICVPMLNDNTCHCYNESVRERDRLAAHNIGLLLSGKPLSIGPLRINGEDISRLRSAFQDGSIRQACAGCEWYELCTGIAQTDFRGCRLRPPQ